MFMNKKTITQIMKDLRSKKYSSVEMTTDYLTRIDKMNPSLNAFITVTHEAALQAAKEADARLNNNTAHPLTGIPIAHKDIFCTQDIRTTCGSKMLENFIAPYDASVVEYFKKAGTVLLGKTNLDEFAMGSSNENSYFGAVKNPWDLERVPGGSSGGSAAAVAAGLVPAATGTDTGGSVRQPAALCGLTGLKPTYGRVSRYGMIAFASSLDQGGAFAHTAEDLAYLIQVMAGYDSKDSTSVDMPTLNYHDALSENIQGLKIGIPSNYFREGLDSEIAAAVHRAAQVFEKMGATLQEITLPNNDLAIPVYYVIAPAECSSNLARYDGVRYGHRCKAPKNLTDLYERSRGEGFGAEVKRRIMTGTYVLSAGYYDAYYLKAQKLRRLISQDFENAFQKVDLILGPTTPTTAFKLNEKVNDPISMYLSDIYTVAVNIAGLPAISFPVGFNQKCPIGAQLIANHFCESRLLNAVHQYQQQSDWHLKTPENF